MIDKMLEVMAAMNQVWYLFIAIWVIYTFQVSMQLEMADIKYKLRYATGVAFIATSAVYVLESVIVTALRYYTGT